MKDADREGQSTAQSGIQGGQEGANDRRSLQESEHPVDGADVKK